MILQCDQCNTKFRLDDSKLKPGGVKVRCSKCRHVFVAGAEQKQEESEFDALLSGLGAPAAAKAPEAAQPVAADSVALDFGAEPAQPKKPAASGDDLDFGDFDFTPEGAGEPEAQPTAAEARKQEAAAGGDFDLGDFDFAAEAAPPSESPAQPAGGVETPAADSFDFGEFSFDEPTAAAPEDKKAPAPAADALDFGELSFDETPVAREEKAAAAAADVMDFGEFSFEETPVAPREEKPAAAADAMDFGEFSFEETPVAPQEEKPATSAADAMDFGEFSFDETPAGLGEEKAAPAAADANDFGEFSFEEAPVPAQEAKQLPAATDAADLSEFSFAEQAPASEEQQASAAAATMDFGDFTFEEPPSTPEASAAAAPAGADSVTPAGQEQQRKVPAPEPDEEFSFGEFSFSEEPEPAPVSKPAPQVPGAASAAAAGVAGLAAAAGTKEPETAAPAAAPMQPGPFDFSFGDKTFATAGPDEMPEDEELPPLSIMSRRKGRSAFTIAIITISVLVVLALSAAGLYMLQSGPAALEKLDKLGIGFVAKWFGMEVPEEGRITIRSPLASFHQNKEAGELFVVTGEAVNSFRKSRASIQVKVSVFDKSGKVLVEKTAYCGNRLSSEQLATLPMEKLESIMNNQFGDSLSNLGVKPGQPIGFVVALANVPKEAADFGVTVVGSTVAAGQ